MQKRRIGDVEVCQRVHDYSKRLQLELLCPSDGLLNQNLDAVEMNVLKVGKGSYGVGNVELFHLADVARENTLGKLLHGDLVLGVEGVEVP